MFLILHGFGFHLYLIELQILNTFANFLGTIINLVSFLIISLIIVGIWKRKEIARKGVIIYSFIYFGLMCYVNINSYFTEIPDESFAKIFSAVYFTLLNGAFLGLAIGVVKSVKVKQYFKPNSKSV
ncbi:MAG: hypothetical protein ACMZ7B_03940 [Balneola sp.]